MRRLLTATITAAVLAVAPAIATAETETWVAVDDVESGHSFEGFWWTAAIWTLSITGVAAGETEPSTTVYFTPIYDGDSSGVPNPVAEGTHERCHRVALLAMTRPGRYELAARFDVDNGVRWLTSCKLRRID